MDEFLFAAAVWMVDKRLAGAIMPALDQTLRDDIDSQAGEVVAFKQFWGTSPDSFAVPPPRRVIWTRASQHSSSSSRHHEHLCR
jgi:hypothetical protein